MVGSEEPIAGDGTGIPSAQGFTTDPARGRGEIFIEGRDLVVSFHLPELSPGDLAHRVGSRTVSVWSQRPGHDFRTIVVLPFWVQPGEYMIHHKNGVWEFLLRLHEGHSTAVAA